MSNKVNENEEVDLGSLFIIIGRGFTKLVNFFGRIFKGIFDFIIQSLLFVRENSIKLMIATVVGAILGITLEVKSPSKYESSLFLKPNFKSSRQLYNNVEFYNDLVKQKNTNLLASIFKISNEEAASLKRFTIDPVVNENDILTSYDDLLQSIDTTTVKDYSYTKFQNSFTKFDYKVHKVSVTTTQNDVFMKLSNAIISSIINNDYFKNLKKINKQNLLRTDSLLRKNLQQADSLHYVYKKVMLKEAQTAQSGTNINLSETKAEKVKELDLFTTNIELNKSLVDVNNDLSETSEVINIVSNFQPVGHQIKEINRNKGFQFAVASFLLMIVFLLLLKLNRFLNTYKKVQ
ncbi:hypothetical protein [Tenacibaculum sp. M341]|uniref:hypothetical protein n=1 Tax=Tenacibaculum sp. M341 TaxID=2530339 RepID=UPI0010486EEE|nr:hypothetical protein [Tenacibaculum sp. M341]TCI84769.1 hypothetical protein EYW44_19755 [Tenacibaculum sp. M341]